MTSDEKTFQQLRSRIIQQFLLGKDSIHGPQHWARVETIGLKLVEDTGADATIVRLFSIFHDSRRETESIDPDHGSRGAQLAETFRGRFFDIDDVRFEKLLYACRHHTGGKSSDITIATCFDADRLDLYRVGIVPDPKFLNTDAAKKKDMIKWSVALMGK
jgi:uncharacterized protein